jgi:hypothetical protein
VAPEGEAGSRVGEGGSDVGAAGFYGPCVCLGVFLLFEFRVLVSETAEN